MRTREQIIAPLVKNRSVLDLGSCWGDFDAYLRRCARDVSTLDVEPGADYQGDLNRPIDLGRAWDVVVAGELIEHVENTAVFLENVRRHMARDGLFFLTTPNSTSFRFFAYALVGREPAFEGHVCYFSRDALALVLKKYFSDVAIGVTNNTTNIARKNRAWRAKFLTECVIGDVVPRLAPNLFAICRH